MTKLQSCKLAKLLLTEMHKAYIVCVCVHTAVTGEVTEGHTAVTYMSHAAVTYWGHRVAQLLHGEVTGGHTAVCVSLRQAGQRGGNKGRCHRFVREVKTKMRRCICGEYLFYYFPPSVWPL